MSQHIHDIIESVLTTEELRTLYTAGNSIDRSDLRQGMIFTTRTGNVRIFDEIKSPNRTKKEYVYWQSGGGGTGLKTTLNFRREITKLLYEQHPELPDRVFPDWVTE